MDKIVFGKPSLGQLEINAKAEVLRSGWVGTGKKVRDFEKDAEVSRVIDAVKATFPNNASSRLSGIRTEGAGAFR